MDEQRYITRVGKIISRQKFPDRASNAFVFRPEEPLKRKYGILYFVCEILNPDPEMNDIIKAIVDTTCETYYKDLEKEPLTSFEEALKKVNNVLFEIAESGEISWVSKINAIIACLSSNHLFLTQTGNAQAYLIRNEKVTNISKDLAPPTITPKKTFANIASGTLEVGDKVIFSTAELFYHFAPQDLARILSRFSPATAASYIVKMLRKEEVESISTLILELTTEEIVSEKVLESEPKEFFGPEKRISVKLNEFLLKFSKQAKIGIEKALPKIKELSKQIKISYKEKVEPKLKEGLLKTKKELEKKKIEISPDRFERIKNYLYKIGKKIKEFKGKESAIAIGLLLIFIVALSSACQYQKKKIALKREEIKEIYMSCKELENAANAAMTYKDNKKARELIQEALDKLKKIEKSTYLHDEIAELTSELKKELDKVTNTIRLNKLNPIGGFTSEPKLKTDGLLVKEHNIYSFSKEKSNLLRYDMINKKAEILKEVEAGEFADAIIKENEIIFLTKNPVQIISYNLENNLVKIEEIIFGEEEFVESPVLGSYYNKIYLIDKKENQIKKYSKTPEGYSRAIDYIINPDLYDLSDAIDMAIDGFIYVLKEDGTILKFLAGVGERFKIEGIPQPEELSPVKIFTNENLTYIYLADPAHNRIVEVDKNGNYVRQFISPTLDQIDDLFVDPKTKELFILKNSEIYEIPL